jgi:hypothetical protein
MCRRENVIKAREYIDPTQPRTGNGPGVIMPRKILRNGFNRRSFFTGATRAGRCGLALVAAGLIGAARAQSPGPSLLRRTKAARSIS